MNPSSFEVTVAGIPLWLVRDYLMELGGKKRRDGRLQGDGWVARLTQAEDRCVGSLRVGRVHLAILGSAEAVDRIRTALEKKLLRAGG